MAKKKADVEKEARREKEAHLRLYAAYEALSPLDADGDDDEMTRAVFKALIAARNVNREDSYAAEIPRIVAQALAFRIVGIGPDDDSAYYGVWGDKIVAFYRALSVCKSYSDIQLAISESDTPFWGDEDAEEILPILKLGEEGR